MQLRPVKYPQKLAQKSATFFNWVNSVIANDFRAWIPPTGVIKMTSENLLEDTDSSYAIRKQS